MSYVTYTDMGGPTVWLDPEDAVDEWARVNENRKEKTALVQGGRHREPGSKPPVPATSGKFRSKYD